MRLRMRGLEGGSHLRVELAAFVRAHRRGHLLDGILRLRREGKRAEDFVVRANKAPDLLQDLRDRVPCPAGTSSSP